MITTHIGEGSGRVARVLREAETPDLEPSGSPACPPQISLKFGRVKKILETEGCQRDKSLFHLTAIRFLKSGDSAVAEGDI